MLDGDFFLVLDEEGEIVAEVVADDAPKARDKTPLPSVLLAKVLNTAVGDRVILMIHLYRNCLLLLQDLVKIDGLSHP